MANILAGQRAAFTKAFQNYQRTEDEAERRLEAEKMAQIILRAPTKGLTREEVVQDKSIPLEVEELVRGQGLMLVAVDPTEPDPDTQIAELKSTVDTTEMREVGEGPQMVYAYGYRCASDRLKIGRTEGDAITRIAAQVNTSTPDKPSLRLVIRTRNCAALEKAIHGILQYRGRAVTGGGTEWFLTNTDEVCRIYASVIGEHG